LSDIWKELVEIDSKKVWKAVQSSMEDHTSGKRPPKKDHVKDAATAMERLQKTLKELFPYDGPLLFAIDEARLLFGDQGYEVSLFRYLRRAWRSLCVTVARAQEELSPVMILTDTAGRISELMPSLRRDDSARHFISGSGTDLFRPIFRLDTFDILSEDETLSFDEKECQSDKRVLSYGRPGWRSLFDSESTLEEILCLADLKVTGHTILHEADTSTVKLAILALRFGFMLANSVSLTEKLVASHMATVVDVSPDREFMAMNYPSEPILVEAAARVMHDDSAKDGYGYERIVDYANHIIPAEYSDLHGYRGELIARMLLLQAADHVLQKDAESKVLQYHQAFQCGEYLSILTGHSIEGFDASFLKGTIFLTHFVKIVENLTVEHLWRAWNRGCGLILAKRSPGVDLVIPVRVRGDVDERCMPKVGCAEPHIELSAAEHGYVKGCFSAILVQVKNKHFSSPRSGVGVSWKDDVSPLTLGMEDWDKPYCAMVFDIGNTTKSATTKPITYDIAEARTLSSECSLPLHLCIKISGLPKALPFLQNCGNLHERYMSLSQDEADWIHDDKEYVARNNCMTYMTPRIKEDVA
jgi:hypothetical protein